MMADEGAIVCPQEKEGATSELSTVRTDCPVVCHSTVSTGHPPFKGALLHPSPVLELTGGLWKS